MQYNFDEIINRYQTDAIKVDKCKDLFGSENVIPMWVADMDFRTPDFVIEAIQKRLEHPILGYTSPPSDLFDVFVEWTKTHHNWQPDVKKVSFVPGIVPALALAVQCFSNPNDDIIVQPPVYLPFMNVINNNNRNIIFNPLKIENGRFVMDFDDLEKKITEKTKLLILCNPHNPGGKIWSRDCLLKLANICAKHKIIVLSDEIHADMALFGNKHIPFASVSEEASQNSLTFMSPSKTFNIPGLKASFYIVPNQDLFQKYSNYLQATEVKFGNIFAYQAVKACYLHGEDWKKQMINYVEQNVNFLIDFIKKNTPKIKVMRPDASFLVWLDCRKLKMNSKELQKFFVEQAGLGLNNGAMFGPGGEQHMRINVAHPHAIVKQAMNQLKSAINSL